MTGLSDRYSGARAVVETNLEADEGSSHIVARSITRVLYRFEKRKPRNGGVARAAIRKKSGLGVFWNQLFEELAGVSQNAPLSITWTVNLSSSLDEWAKGALNGVIYSVAYELDNIELVVIDESECVESDGDGQLLMEV